MKIQQRSPGSWYLTWELGRDGASGKRRQKSETVRGTREEAEKRWYQVQQEIDAGRLSARGLTLFQEVAQRWAMEVMPVKVRLNTRKGYQNVLRRYILPRWGTIPVNRITTSDIDHWYYELMHTPFPRAREGLSGRTVRHVHAVMSQIMRNAVRWDLIPHSPMDRMELPSVKAKPLAVWTDAEIARFWELARLDHYAPIFRLALFTGMRQGEILGLHWTDWEGAHLTVRRILTWDPAERGWKEDQPKTQKSLRQLPLGADTQALLYQHQERQQQYYARHQRSWEPNTWIFQTRSGKPISARNLMRNFYALVERAGVPSIRFHDLRHTHASWLIRHGSSPRVVADRLGHAKISFTLDTYVHLDAHDQQVWADAFEQRIDEQLSEHLGHLAD